MTAQASVLAAHSWPTNAHLIADMARLGYLRQDDHIIDPTFGLGKWWTIWRPDRLTAHDIDPAKGDGVDYRDLPEGDNTFDAGVFDPPYMAPGGRTSTSTHEFNHRFGLHTTPATPIENQASINAGLDELARVLKPRARLLVKCMDYINGGALFPGTHLTLSHAINAGYRYVDRIEHVGRPGPQPKTNIDGSARRQVHARRNLSTLFVLEAPNRTQSSLFGSEAP